MIDAETFDVRWNRILEILYRWEPLGFREVKNGAKLIGHVPVVAPNAYLHRIFAPLNSQSIREMENRLGISFPVAIVNFYLLTNGMNLFSDSISISGVRENYIRTGDAAVQPYDIVNENLYDARPKGATKSIVIIGGYNWDGSLLYFDAQGSSPEAICRCSRDSVEPLNKWTDIWTMLEGEIDRLSNLYGKDGLVIPDTRTTPPKLK